MKQTQIKAVTCEPPRMSSSASVEIAKTPKRAEFPKLKWDDFQGEPDSDSSYYAHSYWKVNYTYTVTFGGQRAIIKTNAKCDFERDRAWVKLVYKSQELLEHEQGHYYIGCLCALTFMKRVKDARLLKTNYQVEIKRIFRETLKEFVELEKQYDNETHHFKEKEIQKKWDKDVENRINELRALWWM